MGRLYSHSIIMSPTIITGPGEYRTRGGETVTVTGLRGRTWADGNYADGTREAWDVTGRLLPWSLSLNDIISAA